MRVLTVTLNAAVDTTYFMGSLHVGEVNRVERVLTTPGGKGNNVARVLSLLGRRVRAAGLVGGPTGRAIEDGLRELGVETAFLRLEAESRRCLTIIEAESGAITEVLEGGPEVTREEAERFVDLLAAESRRSDVVVLSGSLPRGLAPAYYGRLVRSIRANGVRVAVDTSGAALEEALAAGPHLVKPNADEMESLVGAGADVGAMLRYARGLLLGGAMPEDGVVLLSLGAEGAALVTRQGSYLASPPRVAVVNTVGCGDALLAGYLHSQGRREGAESALAHAVATGTAAALQATAGVVDLADVRRFLGEVRVRPVQEDG